MYIAGVESHLKNSGATHGPEREFHEGSDGFYLASPTPGFPVSFPNWVLFYLCPKRAPIRRKECIFYCKPSRGTGSQVSL